ncbi:MAG: hypothetical protein IT168_29020 [Bryobacterales bacterium]|nr:hypothetical protein [Bryobacterales bacterium]
MRARFGGSIKWIFAAIPAVPEIAVGHYGGDAIQVFQELVIADVHASSPWRGPRGVRLWETGSAGLERFLCPGVLPAPTAMSALR